VQARSQSLANLRYRIFVSCHPDSVLQQYSRILYRIAKGRLLDPSVFAPARARPARSFVPAAMKTKRAAQVSVAVAFFGRPRFA
jgi:hypothetical protein